MISAIDLLWLLCNKCQFRKEGKHKELCKRRSTIQVFEKEGLSCIWQRRSLEQNESYDNDYDDDDDDDVDGGDNIDFHSNMSIRCPFNSNNNNNNI